MSENYSYEDDIFCYEFHNNEFTNDIYQEFNLRAKKLGLDSKIDDLLGGEIINFTENQAALHPKYRKNNGYIEELIKSGEIISQEIIGFKDFSEHIVVIGIGGSYEGPKLLIESLGLDELHKGNISFITGSDKNEFNHKLKI